MALPEISITQAVRGQSVVGRQGFKRCGCKGGCDNRRCKCKASKILCNSRCKCPASCSNKGESVSIEESLAPQHPSLSVENLVPERRDESDEGSEEEGSCSAEGSCSEDDVPFLEI